MYHGGCQLDDSTFLQRAIIPAWNNLELSCIRTLNNSIPAHPNSKILKEGRFDFALACKRAGKQYGVRCLSDMLKIVFQYLTTASLQFTEF